MSTFSALINGAALLWRDAEAHSEAAGSGWTDPYSSSCSRLAAVATEHAKALFRLASPACAVGEVVPRARALVIKARDGGGK